MFIVITSFFLEYTISEFCRSNYTVPYYRYNSFEVICFELCKQIYCTCMSCVNNYMQNVISLYLKM